MDEQAAGTVTGQPEAAQGERGADDAGAALVDEELLVEEVSIDGMCGVY
jgi:mycofactocin precursor